MAGMLSAAVFVSAAGLLTSCADWPDDLDPNDWYSAVAGEEATPDAEGAPSGADEDYPNLSEVPEAPENVSSPEEIDQVAQSLAADQANAQYTSDIVRADDETSPAAVPVPTEVEVVEIEEETIITVGEEIDIADAQSITVVESAEQLAAPASEEKVALAGETLVVTSAAIPNEDGVTETAAAASVVESLVETKVIRDEPSELVSGVTRVVSTSVATGDTADQEMMVAAATAPSVEPVDPNVETLVVVISETTDEPMAEPMAEPAAEEESVVLASMSGTSPSINTNQAASTVTGSGSLVAQSERDITSNIVVVPEYIAAADISTPQQVNPETLTVTTDQPAAAEPSGTTTTEVPGIFYEDLSFDELFDASGPDATLQTQTVAAAGSPTTVINDATFTTAGNALLSETLAAIIRFGHGSSSLGQKEREIVAQLAAIYRQTGGKIRLIGHASRSATGLADADQELVNFKVSLDRATAVADALIRNGVPQGDILIEAAAADSSMAEAAGIVNEAVDRRVEVYFGV